MSTLTKEFAVRVTAETKQATEATIRDAARRLFVRKGLEETSTRDIAKAAKIAVGTLFNYFESKEHLAIAIVGEAFDVGRQEALARLATRSMSLEEELFTLIAADLRALEAYRSILPEVLESSLSPFAASRSDAKGHDIRTTRLHDATSLLNKHSLADFASPAVMHLYWSLYLGVLSFWSHDESPSREDTWALLDHSIRMFTASLKPFHAGVTAPAPTVTSTQPTGGAQSASPAVTHTLEVLP